MAIRVTCPNAQCGKQVKINDELAGKRVKCPSCRQVLPIPPGTTGPRTDITQDVEPASPERGKKASLPSGNFPVAWLCAAAVMGLLLVATGSACAWFFWQGSTLQGRLADAELSTQRVVAEAEQLKNAVVMAEQQTQETTAAKQALSDRIVESERGLKNAAARTEELAKRIEESEQKAAAERNRAEQAAVKVKELSKSVAALEQQLAEAGVKNQELSQRLADVTPEKKSAPSIDKSAGKAGDEALQVVRQFEKQGDKQTAALPVLSHNGRLALSTWDDGEIFLWNAQTGALLHRFVGHNGKGITALALSADSRQFLSGGSDGRVSLWDVGSRKAVVHFERMKKGPVFEFKGKELILNPPEVVLFGPKAPIALSFSRLEAWLWDVGTGKGIRPLNLGPDDLSFSRAVFSPDGRWVLASVQKKKSVTYELGVWDAETGNEVRRFPGSFKDEHWIHRLAVTPSGEHLVTCSMDKTIRTWDIKAGREIKCFTVPVKGALSVFALSSDGALALSIEQDLTLKWVTERIELGGGQFEIRATQKKVPEGEPRVHLWDVQSEKRLGARAYKGNGLYDAAFSPNNRHVLIGGPSGLQLWENALRPKTADDSIGADESKESDKQKTFEPITKEKLLGQWKGPAGSGATLKFDEKEAVLSVYSAGAGFAVQSTAYEYAIDAKANRVKLSQGKNELGWIEPAKNGRIAVWGTYPASAVMMKGVLFERIKKATKPPDSTTGHRRDEAGEEAKKLRGTRSQQETGCEKDACPVFGAVAGLPWDDSCFVIRPGGSADEHRPDVRWLW